MVSLDQPGEAPDGRKGIGVRYAVSFTLHHAAIRLRHLAGSAYPKGHPLRVFHHQVAETLKPVPGEYLRERA